MRDPRVPGPPPLLIQRRSLIELGYATARGKPASNAATVVSGIDLDQKTD